MADSTGVEFGDTGNMANVDTGATGIG